MSYIGVKFDELTLFFIDRDDKFSFIGHQGLGNWYLI
jgi:hypothetical protein